MKTYFLFSMLMAAALQLTGCGTGSTQQAAGGGQPAAPQTPGAPASETVAEGSEGKAATANQQKPKEGDVLRMQKHFVHDKETNANAFSFLMPTGWKADEKLYWFAQDNIVPVRYEATIASPAGGEQIQLLPRFVSSYFYNALKGEMVGIEPPADAQAALRDLVIPYNRKGIDYKILGMKPFKVEGIPSQGAYETRTSGAVATIEYDLDGQPYEEEFYLTLFTLTSQMAMMDMDGVMRNRPNGQLSIDNARAVRAPKGKLEEARKVLFAMVGSTKYELPWYNQVQQVSQMLQKQFYQNLAAQGQISKIISQTNREVSQTINDSWQKQQESQDRQHHQFTNYIRDVDDYKAPDGNGSVSLPSGYQNVYSNGSEYILTNTQYDPNADINQTTNWNKLETVNP